MGQEYLKNSFVEVEISVAQEILQKTVKKFSLCLEILICIGMSFAVISLFIKKTKKILRLFLVLKIISS